MVKVFAVKTRCSTPKWNNNDDLLGVVRQANKRTKNFFGRFTNPNSIAAKGRVPQHQSQEKRQNPHHESDSIGDSTQAIACEMSEKRIQMRLIIICIVFCFRKRI